MPQIYSRNGKSDSGPMKGFYVLIVRTLSKASENNVLDTFRETVKLDFDFLRL